MVDAVFAQTASLWISLAFIYLFASLFGESNAHIGGFLVPCFASIFVFTGWINYSYAAEVATIGLVLGALTFLREHARQKYGVGGSASGLLPKIMLFVLMLQMSVIFVNGLGIYETQFAPNPSSQLTGYSVEDADSVFGKYARGGESTLDSLQTAALLGIGICNMVWSLVLSTVSIYPWIISTFHVPSSIATVLSAGYYLLLGVSIVTIVRGGSVEP